MSKRPKGSQRANAAWGGAAAGLPPGRYRATPMPGGKMRHQVVVDDPEHGRREEHLHFPEGGEVIIRTADGEHPEGYFVEERGAWRPLSQFVIEDWHPRPPDVVGLRDQLVEEWRPGGQLERMERHLIQYGGCGPATWEHDTMRTASLWYVAEPMCDLLEGAAPSMPLVALTPELVPDKRGFVVFQRCLEGKDADGSDNPVSTGAMLWGPAMWTPPPDFGGGPVPALGVTVYRPLPNGVAHGLPMSPIGSLVWPLGTYADVGLTEDEAKDDSMEEDRRRLAALWVLSTQEGLAGTEDAPLPRSVRRRAARMAQEPPRVRVVHLRRPGPKRAPGEPTGRHLQHRFIVRGHWKQVAYGPRHSQHYPKWIDAFPKGPEGAPFLKSTTVKAWDRE